MVVMVSWGQQLWIREDEQCCYCSAGFGGGGQVASVTVVLPTIYWMRSGCDGFWEVAEDCNVLASNSLIDIHMLEDLLPITCHEAT
jgi:hypothetical protein